MHLPELCPAVEGEARARLGFAEADPFLTRLDQLSFDITEPLSRVYGGVADPEKLATQLVLDALDAAAVRPAALRLLDRRREIDPAWFQRSRMIGYVCYADRFAGSLGAQPATLCVPHAPCIPPESARVSPVDIT